MTDGEFNTAYCQGVISRDSTSPGPSSDRINCDAPNGNSFSQSRSLCTNMKATGILVYTIGFDLSTAECQGPDDTIVRQMLRTRSWPRQATSSDKSSAISRPGSPLSG